MITFKAEVMKQGIGYLLLSLCTFLFCIGCSNETDLDLYSSLNGQVTDMQTGEPIKGASITLTPGGMTTVTGSDGNFGFVNLDPGLYTVIVQSDGYMTNRKNVNAVAGESHHVDVPLSKIP